MRQQIGMYWDINTNQRLDVDDPTKVDPAIVTLFKNNNYYFDIQFYKDGGQPNFIYDGADEWEGGLGNLGTGSPLITVSDAEFNIDAGADPGTGRITFRLDTYDNAALNSDIGTVANKKYYIEVRWLSMYTSEYNIIAVIPVWVSNTTYQP